MISFTEIDSVICCEPDLMIIDVHGGQVVFLFWVQYVPVSSTGLETS